MAEKKRKRTLEERIADLKRKAAELERKAEQKRILDEKRGTPLYKAMRTALSAAKRAYAECEASSEDRPDCRSMLSRAVLAIEEAVDYYGVPLPMPKAKPQESQ